jgi:hypothetical protein
MSDISINLVFEDLLSESVLRKLLENSRKHYAIGLCYNTRGYGWIREKVNGLNLSAKGMPYLVLTDLDRYECPPVLLNEWLIGNKNHNLLFRVAVRQVESWLLGCRTAIAEFLGIREDLIPEAVDEIPNAKAFLIDLAKRSRKKQVRLDIVPKGGSTAKIGPDYNGRMIHFVEHFWKPNVAKNYSPSLLKTMKVLDEFEPIFESSS